MKKITVFLAIILFTGALFGQYASQGYRYPYQFGMGAPGTVTGGVIYLKGLTSGRVKLMPPAIAGAATDVTLPSTSGTLATTQNISDSLAATTTIDTTFIYLEMDTLQSNIDLKVSIADSTPGAGHYASNYDLVTGLAAKLNTTDTLAATTLITMQSDTVPKFVFGAGVGQPADSILFARNENSFGVFNNYPSDSIYVVNFKNLFISAGDSLTWNCYYGNYMTGVVTDSLFTGPQETGVNETFFTPDNERTIPPNMDVWIALKGTQITAWRPKKWALQMNTQTVNRSY